MSDLTLVTPDPSPVTSDSRARFRDGMRRGVPFGFAGALLAVSFPVLAADVGFSGLAAIAMSVFVFAGAAQFTAVAILAQGGGAGAAILGATMMNARYLPMGIALGPSLPGRWLSRALQGQAMVDSSWAMAARGDGSFDRWLLFGATLPMFCCWVGGTIIGVAAGDRLGDPESLGLDAVFPAFFLALLIAEMRGRRSVSVALGGAAIALAMTPILPDGLPILIAGLAALVGVVRAQDADPATETHGNS